VSVKTPPDLARILHEEARLYEELLGALRDEERALIEGGGQRIAQSVSTKERLILEIRLAELSRQAAVRQIAGRTDTPLRDLPGADSGDLARARARLSSVLPAVADASRRVSVLLGRALGRLHDTLDVIQEIASGGPGYTAAAVRVRSSRPTLDGRA
jgi:hypothetical protein